MVLVSSPTEFHPLHSTKFTYASKIKPMFHLFVLLPSHLQDHVSTLNNNLAASTTAVMLTRCSSSKLHQILRTRPYRSTSSKDQARIAKLSGQNSGSSSLYHVSTTSRSLNVSTTTFNLTEMLTSYRSSADNLWYSYSHVFFDRVNLCVSNARVNLPTFSSTSKH